MGSLGGWAGQQPGKRKKKHTEVLILLGGQEKKRGKKKKDSARQLQGDAFIASQIAMTAARVPGTIVRSRDNQDIAPRPHLSLVELNHLAVCSSV